MSSSTNSIDERALVLPAASAEIDISPAAAPPVVAAAERIHYLDNLRALAMMLGVFLHAALAYANPAQVFWLATDIYSSTAVDASIWFIHLFRMSLFFLLSGYFSKLMIDRKGLRSFLWNRAVRLVAPMALFYVPLLIAITAVIVLALGYVEQPRGLLGLIAAEANGESAKGERNSISLMHLWFLYYLIIFSIMGAVGYKWRPIRFDWLFNRPLLAALLPLALVPAVFAIGSPLPAPESFVPTWWPIVFYGPFYLAGWQLYGRESWLERIDRQLWPLLLGSIVLYLPYYLLLPTIDLALLSSQADPRPMWMRGATALLTAYMAVSLTLVSIALGKRYLTSRSGWLRFTSESSYWVYLIHLPIVIFLQTLLIPVEISLWLKLAIVTLGTLAFSLATYVVFVRYTPIGWLLHGKKKFP